MPVTVIESATSVRATTWVKVTDGPPIKADHLDRMISPHAVKINYVYHRVPSPDGWTVHRWIARDVTVHGHHILKPAKDGTERLGLNVHRTSWSSFGDEDLIDATGGTGRRIPEWVSAIIESQRPSGELALVGLPG